MVETSVKIFRFLTFHAMIMNADVNAVHFPFMTSRSRSRSRSLVMNAVRVRVHQSMNAFVNAVHLNAVH